MVRANSFVLSSSSSSCEPTAFIFSNFASSSTASVSTPPKISSPIKTFVRFNPKLPMAQIVDPIITAGTITAAFAATATKDMPLKREKLNRKGPRTVNATIAAAVAANSAPNEANIIRGSNVPIAANAIGSATALAAAAATDTPAITMPTENKGYSATNKMPFLISFTFVFPVYAIASSSATTVAICLNRFLSSSSCDQNTNARVSHRLVFLFLLLLVVLLFIPLFITFFATNNLVVFFVEEEEKDDDEQARKAPLFRVVVKVVVILILVVGGGGGKKSVSVPDMMTR
mmetsp:Transcript_3486/g.10706  ORF Transcript_3486/g.10706 Transcript_3486/m.10706 type:complete len:288 (-) Transcript_3486:730-1593(-)